MKPQWSQMMTVGHKMEREGQDLCASALEIWCLVQDSGGARCTADQLPEHAHRYDRKDLPE